MDRLLDILIRGIVWFARFSKTLARIGIGQYEEWQPGRKMRILLAGYNGARNTGSDVRVAAIAQQIRSQYGDYLEKQAAMGDFLKQYFANDQRERNV